MIISAIWFLLCSGDAGDPAPASAGPGKGLAVALVRFTRFLPRASDRWMIAIGRSASLPRTEGCKRRRSSNADARRQRTGDTNRTGDPDGRRVAAILDPGVSCA